jgi:hypothetical protein
LLSNSPTTRPGGEAKVFVIEAGIDEQEERMLELAAGNIGTEEVVGWPSDHVARRQGTV